jgi:hypothetical protein
MRQAPKKRDPEIRALAPRSASFCLWPGAAVRGSGSQASSPPPLAVMSSICELPLQRQRQFETPSTWNGTPNQNPSGFDGVGFPQARRMGVSGPFCSGALWPACGGLTSPSSGAPRTQSFSHQLLDYFAAGRLRLRLRRNERVHASQQFWRHPHAHRRPGSCLIRSRFSSRAHNPSVWLVQGHIEDLEVDEKPYLTRFRR